MGVLAGGAELDDQVAVDVDERAGAVGGVGEALLVFGGGQRAQQGALAGIAEAVEGAATAGGYSAQDAIGLGLAQSR